MRASAGMCLVLTTHPQAGVWSTKTRSQINKHGAVQLCVLGAPDVRCGAPRSNQVSCLRYPGLVYPLLFEGLLQWGLN